MNVAQYEHKSTFTDPLPEQTTFDRLEDLFITWRRAKLDAIRKKFQLESFDRMYSLPEEQAADRRNEILNQFTRAELRRAETELEIINVARLLVAEADIAETLEETL